jgi:hypothetical protein
MSDSRLKIPHKWHIAIGTVTRVLLVLTGYNTFQKDQWYGILVMSLYAAGEYLVSKTQPLSDDRDTQ